VAPALDDATFRRLSDECLATHACWLARFDPDELDYRESDGVLTLEFGDGTRYVLNRQSGNRQVWYAAGARAWHYVYDPAQALWLDDRDGHELGANLRRTVAEKLGRPVESVPPRSS
jgi:iron donor protein CyaY